MTPNECFDGGSTLADAAKAKIALKAESLANVGSLYQSYVEAPRRSLFDNRDNSSAGHLVERIVAKLNAGVLDSPPSYHAPRRD